MRFYLSDLAVPYREDLLPRFASNINKTFWLYFDDPTIEGVATSEEINALSNAIEGMKGIYWHHKFFSKDKQARADDLKTDELLDTSKKQLVKSIVDFSNTTVNRGFHQKFSQYHITWIETENCDEVKRTFGKNPTHSAVAIIPQNDETAWQWANMTYGLAWYALWSISKPKPDTRDFVFDTDSVLVNYVNLTNHIGGIPSLPFSDVDAKRGLLFFGQEAQLQQIYEKLNQVAQAYTDDEFEQYIRRYSPSLRHISSSL